jgi:membrane-bound inhibitor of C-type lysozyme
MDGMPRTILLRRIASGIRVMAMFSKPACLAGAIAILTFGGSADANEAHYRCGGGATLTARFSPLSAPNGRVELAFDTGRKLTLPQVLSADGGRYANSGVEFWIKGRGATLTMNGVKETCSTR